MTEESILPEGYKFCECGLCDKIIPIKDKQGRIKRFYLGHARKGKRKHPDRPNGRYLVDGYWIMYKPDYFSAQKTSGRVREHQFIYQEYHKLCMLPWGHIHHIDGKPNEEDGNRIENLQGMMKRDHDKLNGRKRIDMSGRVCVLCDSKITYIDKKGTHHWYNYHGEFICLKCHHLEYKRKSRRPKDSLSLLLTDYL